MAKMRKKYSAEFKLKAVIEILKEEKTAAQIAGDLGCHPLVLGDWKKHFLETGSQIFAKPGKSSKMNDDEKEKIDQKYLKRWFYFPVTSLIEFRILKNGDCKGPSALCRVSKGG